MIECRTVEYRKTLAVTTAVNTCQNVEEKANGTNDGMQNIIYNIEQANGTNGRMQNSSLLVYYRTVDY